MTDIDLSDPRVLRPLLRVAGIGPEPESAKTPGTGSNYSSPPTSTNNLRLNPLIRLNPLRSPPDGNCRPHHEA
jgi:hypothetical protein